FMKVPPHRTITAAMSSGVTPSDPITVSSTLRPPPRSITVVTSGPVDSVSAKASCYRLPKPDVSTALDNRPGRLAIGYDHTALSWQVTATASAHSAKRGRPFKIALEIQR